MTKNMRFPWLESRSGTAPEPVRDTPSAMLMVAQQGSSPPRMNRLKLPLLAALAILGTATAPARANEQLAQSKNCMSCHRIDSKLVGPAYKDVAAKYAGQAGAVAKLTQKVMKGGAGVWGPVPMPANPQVSEAEATQLVQWILSLK
jgi:cytochrome c